MRSLSAWEKTLPILADKVLIDFINHLEISRDHIRVQRQRQGLTQRFLDSITGKGQERQIEINTNLTEGLDQVKTWLTALHEQDIQNMHALNHLGEKLLETRQGVMKLYAHHQELATLVSHLSADLKMLSEQCQTQFQHFNDRLSFLEAKTLAQDHLEKHILYWQQTPNLPIQAGLSWVLLSLEDLFWGAFGNFYRQYRHHPQSKTFLENARLKLLHAFQVRCYSNSSFDALRPTLSLLEPIRSEHSETRDTLAYLLQENQAHLTPFGWTIHALSTNSPMASLPLKLPRVIKGERLFQHLFDEAAQRASLS